MNPVLIDRARAGLRQHLGREAAGWAFAPGRVNLIGEHTDYNEGFVLPCAIDAGTVVAHAAREDGQIRVVALDEPGEPVDTFDGLNTPLPLAQGHWANHVRGMAAALLAAGDLRSGMDLAIAGSVPRGAGLSSSASLGVALALACRAEAPHPLEAARLAQWSEHHFVGCQCGIMDPLVAAAATLGSALLIDCREPAWQGIAVPDEVGILVAHSGVTRELAAGAYNLRREECARAATCLGVDSLREVDMAAVEAPVPDMEETVWRRARHVVSENARTLQAAEALAAGDLRALGDLLRASHASLRDDFEVTVPEVDALVEGLNAAIVDDLGGLGGARMTGGGFGGCVVALAPTDALAGLAGVARAALLAAGVAHPLVFQSRPGSGMQGLRLS